MNLIDKLSNGENDQPPPLDSVEAADEDDMEPEMEMQSLFPSIYLPLFSNYELSQEECDAMRNQDFDYPKTSRVV